MQPYKLKNPYVTEDDDTVKTHIEVRKRTEPYVFKNPYAIHETTDKSINTIVEETIPQEHSIETKEELIDGKKTETIMTSNRMVKIENAIPVNIYNAIENLQISRIMKEKVIKLVCLIIQKCMYKKHDFTSYILLASTYFEKAFNKDYHNAFFKVVKAAGIIQSNRIYVQGTKLNPGIPYGYRLNQDMLNCPCVPVFYHDKKSGGSIEKSGDCTDKDGGCTNDVIYINRDMTYQKKDILNDIQEHFSKMASQLSNSIPTSISINTTTYNSSSLSLSYLIIPRFFDKASDTSVIDNSNSSTVTDSSTSSTSSLSYLIIPRFFNKSLLIDDLSSLVYDEKKIREANEKHISSITSRLLIDNKVERDFFKVYNVGLKIYYDISKKSALIWAKENNVRLIQDSDHFYFDTLEQYIANKEKSLIVSCNWQIAKMKNKIFYAG